MYNLLSDSESPVKSDQSLEEQDLLEKSTKKSKQDERSPKGPKNISRMDIVQEAPLASTTEPMHAPSSVPPATYRQSLSTKQKGGAQKWVTNYDQHRNGTTHRASYGDLDWFGRRFVIAIEPAFEFEVEIVREISL
nr:hypothetical protein Iba_chr04cCG0400 [Ipomoea batatas]